MQPQQIISRIMLYLIGLTTIITTTQGQDVQNVPPFYLNCSNTTTFTKNSPYENNLKLLLSSLTSNTNTRFFNTSVGQDPDVVYGLYLCRGDVNTDDCPMCVNQASQDISHRCPVNKVAIIWYDYCFLRYSNKIVYHTLDQTSMVYGLNPQNITESQARFMEIVATTLREVEIKAVESPMKFAVKDVNYTFNLTLYMLMECTPDLSASQCQQCLKNIIGRLSDCCTNRLGARVLTPSCYFRYETYLFYNNATPQPPSRVPSSRRKRGESRKIIIGVSISSIIGLLLLLLGCYIYTLRKRKNLKKAGVSETSQEFRLLDLRTSRNGDNNPKGSIEEEMPIIQLDVVHKATHYFSDENKLGEGGFGPVYKGTLENGAEIAVKRLSRNSCQGLREFMNEVILIARLQHKNLVKLLGCCFEKIEKLLIYEYMPNKSLDLFLFDPKLAVQLDWQRRFSIIHGLARGLTYLHEDSRLKIIHRDFKVSNVLLDNDMNPKISDFGMARIFGGNQNQANTNRIVGTYGYMAPEYAMEGLFSVKSDVFSFGVIVLEIISGKKNSGFHLSEQGESLLTYAWKLWSKGQELELMDSSLTKSNVAHEVLKCIHIGLLCVQEDPADRPSMSHVVVMLASDIITLPRPSQPAFSVGRVVPTLSESSSDKIVSVNQVTFSNVAPR